MVKFLTDSHEMRVQLRTSGRDWQIVHFFFDFRRGKSTANDPQGMLKMFLQQLSESVPAISDFLQQPSILARLEELEEEPVESCTDILARAIDATNIDLCAFIDGLDEHHGNLWRLCSQLEVLRTRTGMKMCIASRPEPELLRASRDWLRITMEKHNKQSVQHYIGRRIDQMAAFEPEIDTLFTEALRESIVRKAEGVILWAGLITSELLIDCSTDTTTDELHKKLETFSDDFLSDVYTRILDRIPAHFASDAAIILKLILYLNENATYISLPARFFEAISFTKTQGNQASFLGGRLEGSVMEARTRAWLSNLVEVVDVNSKMQVRLIHLSLAVHLRHSNWLCSHLDPTFAWLDTQAPWVTVLNRVLTTASDELSFDITELVHFRFSQPPFDSKGIVKVRFPTSRWEAWSNLLYSSVTWAPTILLRARSEHILAEDRYRILNLLVITWHFAICNVCYPGVPRDPLFRQSVISAYDAGVLDILTATMHHYHGYCQQELINREMSMQQMASFLEYMLCACSSFGFSSKEATHLLQDTTLPYLRKGFESRSTADWNEFFTAAQTKIA